MIPWWIKKNTSLNFKVPAIRGRIYGVLVFIFWAVRDLLFLRVGEKAQKETQATWSKEKPLLLLLSFSQSMDFKNDKMEA